MSDSPHPDNPNDDHPTNVTNVSGGVNVDAEQVNIGGDVVGGDKITQNTWNNIRHVIVSPWGLIGLAVILAVTALIITGVIKLPAPPEFPPAKAGESLIIVTDLKEDSGSQCSNLGLSQRIYDNLNAWIENDGLTQMGVVAHHLTDRAEGKVEDIGNQAKQIGEQYNATLLLWGWSDLAGITTNLQYVKPNSHNQLEPTNPYRSITDKFYSLQLIVPQSLCSIRDQLYPLSTCQGLVTLGFEEYLVLLRDFALLRDFKVFESLVTVCGGVRSAGGESDKPHSSVVDGMQ